MGNLRLLRHGGPPLEVSRDRALVGRDPSCDVVLDDKSISRRHAYLERRGSGWGIVDQGSANGTFVNGTQVMEADLFDGQELRLGMVPLRVELQSNLAGTVLMDAASAGPSTVLMPTPMSAPTPARSVPPPAVAPRPMAPAMAAVAGGPAPAAWAPEPGYAARPATPQEEAASLLGLPVSASPAEVSARYEELATDLGAKLASARTPNLKQTYQRNMDELRRAAEMLAPGFSSAPAADLPSAQPTVVPDDLDMSMPAPIRAAITAPPQAAQDASKSGVPALSTTILSFTAMTLVAVCAFFSLSRGKMQKALDKKESNTEVMNARAEADKLMPFDQLEKNGALKNGTLKLCNKSGRTLEAAWMGAVYVSQISEKETVPRLFNSRFCEEFKLSLSPGAEQTVQFKGSHPSCNWDGRGVFFAIAFKNPQNPEEFLRTSGIFHNRQDCTNVGEGW